MKTISELRDYFCKESGFTGSWNVLLDGFQELSYGYGSPKVAVALFSETPWFTEDMGELAREITTDKGILLVLDWDKLVQRVKQDALKQKLLVMISGNLVGKNWDKAIAMSGRKDGRIRRSLTNVELQCPYWTPTVEQLTGGIRKPVLPLP